MKFRIEAVAAAFALSIGGAFKGASILLNIAAGGSR